MSYYSRFSDIELHDIYEEMMNSYGKVEDAFLKEIEDRGGLEKFLAVKENKILLQKERNRISTEIYDHIRKGIDLESIKFLVSSDIFNNTELETLIEMYYLRQTGRLKNDEFDMFTLFTTLIGTVIGIVAGTIFLVLTTYLFGKLMYILLLPTYGICYLSIKVLTRKTNTNVVIFIFSMISTIVCFILGLWAINVF